MDAEPGTWLVKDTGSLRKGARLLDKVSDAAFASYKSDVDVCIFD